MKIDSSVAPSPYRVIENMKGGDPAHTTSAAISDLESFGVLSRVLWNCVSNYDGPQLTVAVDSDTAGLAPKSDLATVERSHQLDVYATPADRKKEVPVDRFFVVYSPVVHVAIVGQDNPSEGFSGAWTGFRPLVERIVERFDIDLAVPPTGPSPERSNELFVMSLTASLANHYVARQQDITRDKDDLASVLSILKSISMKRRAHDQLYLYVEQIAAVTGVDRCSIVRVWGGDHDGHVVASNEDPNIRDLRIDLKKYPEIVRAMDERAPVVVNDVHTDPLTQEFSKDFHSAGISAVLVIPILLYDVEIGSFILRAALKGRRFSSREISFCEIVGEAAANALERAHLFERIQTANRRLEHLAITDGLTSLYNHRHFRERLEEEFERATRYDQPLGCILLDMDDFKKINDTFGHLQGDSVLREAADRVARCARKSDLVARYGGEEIVALLPQTDREGATRHANRVLAAIRGLPFEGMPEDHAVTVSIGVAVLDTNTMKDCEQLVQAADKALYKAKADGKDRVVIAGSSSE